MNRRLTTRLMRLEEAFLPGSGDGPMCVHHGSACGLGTKELPELYRLVVESKERQGMTVPPLDEHRAMTPAERAQDAAEYAVLLADLKARNAAIEAQLRAEGS
ncbi:hypothetical protein [Streptomyces sp. NPDC002324]